MLNSEQDSAAAEHFQFHGPSVCAMALRVDDAAQAVARSEALLCPEWREPVGPGERRIPAVRAHSQNKFLYSAIVPIKSSGASDLLVRVKRQGQESSLPIPILVGPPSPPAVAYWPWLAFPFLGIMVFGLHQRLAHRGSSQTAS